MTILKPKKKSESAGCICLLLAFVMIIACLTTACQPTPEKEIIIGKDNSELEEKIQQTVNPGYTFQAPTKYESELNSDDGFFALKVNAGVVIPQDNTIPVVRIEPALITQEMADKAIDVFFGNRDIYKPKARDDRSKTEIEGEIIRLLGRDTDLGRIDPDAYDESIAGELEILLKQLETAPDEYIPQPATTVFEEIVYDERAWMDKNQRRFLPYDGNVEHIDIEGDGLNGQAGRLTIERNAYKDGIINYTEGEIVGGVVTEIDDVSSDSLPDISLDEAKRVAEQMTASIGLNGFKIASCGVTISAEGASLRSEMRYEDVPKCYVVFLTKDYNFPVNYVSNRINNSDAYGRAWENELIRVHIDDTGIVCFTYQSPSSVIETVSENTELLSFDEITDIFEKQIFISAEGLRESSPSLEYHAISIERIQLGLSRIIEGSGKYLCIPVWDFYGKRTTKYSDEDEEYTEKELGYSYLTINAIDGSIIDRSLGY